MEQQWLAALDVGTSRIKAGLWSLDGKCIKKISQSLAPLQYQGLCVEQDLQNITSTIASVLTQLGSPEKWNCLSLTCQRGTLILLDQNHRPIAPMLSWMDRRGDGYLHGRIGWYQQNRPHDFAKVKWLRSLMSWLMEEFTGKAYDTEQTAVTDFVVNDVTVVKPGTCVQSAPTSYWESIVPKAFPIVLAGGDKNCELLGAGTIHPKTAILSCGTALSLGMLVEQKPTDNTTGLFITSANIAQYCQIEIGLPCDGLLSRWLSTNFSINLYKDDIALLKTQSSLCFLPFLNGSLFYPKAFGTITGLSHDTKAKEIISSALEGIVCELIKGVECLTNQNIHFEKIIACGAGSNFDLFLQWLSDALQKPVGISPNPDAGLVGAAMMSAVALGYCDSYICAADRFLPNVTQWKYHHTELALHWHQRYAHFRRVSHAIGNV